MRSINLARIVTPLWAILASIAVSSELPKMSELPAQKSYPDALTMLDGTKVASPEQWFSRRRPELKLLFQHYEYGTLPPRPEKVSFNIQAIYNDFLGGRATLKLVTVIFANSQETNAPFIDLMLVIPNAKRAHYPVFLGVNWLGNQALSDDARIPLAHSSGHIEGDDDAELKLVNGRATEATRGTDTDWPLSTIIERGYAFASFCKGDVDSDLPGISDGIYAWLARQAPKSWPQPHSRGSIAAWAWGFQRCIDYLVQDPVIDPERIAILGHSRNGKAALLAAAFDERIALVIPHQSGQGGAAPARNTAGETVFEINRDFPHWFNAEFKKFNDHPDRLPFDHHELIALVAPRAVLLSNALDDQEANPTGQFKMLLEASRIYEFLGEPAFQAKSMPPTGKLVSFGRLGYFIRPGKHEVRPEDWEAFLAFADQQFSKSRGVAQPVGE